MTLWESPFPAWQRLLIGILAAMATGDPNMLLEVPNQLTKGRPSSSISSIRVKIKSNQPTEPHIQLEDQKIKL